MPARWRTVAAMHHTTASDAIYPERIPAAPTFEIKRGETLRFGLLNLLDDTPEPVDGAVVGEVRRLRGGRRVAQLTATVRGDDAAVVECLLPSSVTRGLDAGDYVCDFVFYVPSADGAGAGADESMADVLYTDTILIRVHPSVTRLGLALAGGA